MILEPSETIPWNIEAVLIRAIFPAHRTLYPPAVFQHLYYAHQRSDSHLYSKPQSYMFSQMR